MPKDDPEKIDINLDEQTLDEGPEDIAAAAAEPDVQRALAASGNALDYRDGAAFRALCDKERPSHVFHAAHPPRDETPTVIEYCYKAMTNILEAAKDFKIQRVVYSSSASIYGQLSKPDGGLVKEDDAVTIYPTYFYRAAKTVSEWMGNFYKEKHGVDFVGRCSRDQQFHVGARRCVKQVQRRAASQWNR